MIVSTARGLATALRRALAAIELTFCKLARIQFDAPWRENGIGRC